MKTSSTNRFLGGSIFWLLFILIALAGLIFLGIWGFQNNNIQAIAITSIMGVMIIAGIILSNFEIFSSGTWPQNSFYFMLGFIIWCFFLGNDQKSVLSLTQNGLFAQIAGQLPLSLEFAFNTYIIPICEEVFWMIGLPYTINLIMDLIGQKYAIVKNVILKIVVIALFTMITFAFFHVAKLIFAFLIGAMIFRLFMVLSVIGEPQLASRFHALRFFMIVPAFSVGAHIGNNWADKIQGPGFLGGVDILVHNPVIGIIVLVFGIVMLISSVYYVRSLLPGKGRRA